MNSSPYALPALIVCVAALFGCGTWAVLAIIRQPAAGKHARQAAASAEAASFAAGLAQDHFGWQPDPPPPPAAERWWEEPPPAPPAVEVLTGPGAPSPQTSDTVISVLARVRDALLPDVWRPEPGEVTFTAADPDATMTDLPAVQDAPQYLAAPQ